MLLRTLTHQHRQYRLRLVAYGFLQTSPLASDALAIRIIFPSDGAILPFFRQTGLPTSQGKHKMLPFGEQRLKAKH
ncbi:hypothetical protein FM037_11025 [Shewanella psychropiezotolerans]|uniref:Uncharacterized protein n=1 Tax=Shewanella psychropiezotolerans TaxID=2593655 RepID=A0ABX5WX46_9GAMM|nr:hypothetical protein FM037_11025 [Shewanella psychropiezotolerans]